MSPNGSVNKLPNINLNIYNLHNMRDTIWLQKSLTLSVQNDHLLQDDLNFKLNLQVFNEQISARISFGQTGKKVF